MFGNPGTTELPLMDAFATENEMRYVLGLQEAAVMAMADGYAQASGKLAVVNLHVAPGPRQRHGHAVRRAEGGLADPRHRRPARAELHRHRADPVGRSADHRAADGEMVVARSTRLADLPRLVHRAAKTALAPPTGPVFLSLPGDILRADADLDLMAPTRVAPRTARRQGGGRGGGRAARQRQASGDHGGRRGGAEPRACRAGRAGRAARRAGLCRIRAEHGVVSRPRTRCSAAR